MPCAKSDVIHALQRILESPQFQRTSRAAHFLRFLTLAALEGNESLLKEYWIGIKVFDKRESFDPRLDSIVRVEASRLRVKLAQYYATNGNGDPIQIEIPKGGYIPVFQRRAIQASASDIPKLPLRRRVSTEGPLVGRERELEALRRLVEQVKSGKGALVTLIAEPGVGKTTLAEAILTETERNGAVRVARGGCRYELERTEPYLCWLEALGELVRDDSEADALLRNVAPVWRQSLRLSTLEGLISGPPVKRQIERFFQVTTARHPLVLFLDDFHWADLSSIDLLSFLAPGIPSIPLLLVVAYRQSDLALRDSPFLRVAAELDLKQIRMKLSLPPFNLSDTQAFLARRFPNHTFRNRTIQMLQVRSGGNPLCLAALTAHAAANGWLVHQNNRWCQRSEAAVWLEQLPPSIEGMVSKKIMELRKHDRSLLCAAAVQGSDFDSATTAKALAVDPQTVEKHFRKLEDAHQLVRRLGEVLTPEAGVSVRYRFGHVLYQEALLKSMGPSQQAQVYRSVAAAITEIWGEEDRFVAASAARLLEAAGAIEAALRFYLLAVGNAIRLSAYKQAYAIAEHAGVLARRLPPSESGARLEIEILTLQASAAVAMRDLPTRDMERLYKRAIQVGRHLKDSTPLQSVALLYWDSVSVVDYSKAHPLAVALVRGAESSAPGCLSLAKMAEGITLFHIGRPQQAAARLLEASDCYSSLGPDSGVRYHLMDPRVPIFCNRARALWFAGQPDASSALCQDALTIASATGHERTIAYALALAGDIAHLRRDAKQTLEHIEEAEKLAAKHDLAYELTWCALFRAWAFAATDRLGDALVLFDRYGSLYRGPGATKFLCHFAEALGKAQRISEGLNMLEQVFSFGEQHGEHYYDSELLRIRGELLLRNAPCDSRYQADAEHAFNSALSVARQQGAKSCELRAASSLVRFAGEFRPQAVACAKQVLTDIMGKFAAKSRTIDLEEAGSLL